MTRAELVAAIKDRVAARLCAPGSRPTYMQEDMARDIATAALAAIEAAGFVCVPREATPEMLRVADNAMPPPHEEDPDDDRFVLYATWRAQWFAMLAASPLAQEARDAE